MYLASTSDIIRIVTGSAVSTIGVQAAWVDSASGTTTPGRTNTQITTATTTTVVGSPGASTVRNVRSLIISNNHASSSCLVTIQHYDGTTSVDIEKITLAAGEQFAMSEDGEWRHLTAYGAEYDFGKPGDYAGYGIAGTIAETIQRHLCNENDNAAPASGTLVLHGVYLKAGDLVSNISFCSGGTAAGTPTNQMFGLFDSTTGALLAQSANDTTTAWAANTIKTLAMTTPYRVQVSGMYYIGFMVTATTLPTLKGVSGTTASGRALPSSVYGASTTGLTTALPNPALRPTTTSGSTPAWAAIT